jgi:hypothetical protein
MSRRALFACGVLIVAAFAWWRAGGDSKRDPATSAPAASVTAPTTLPVDSVLRVRPQATAAVTTTPPAGRTLAKPVSPLVAQFRSKRDFAGLYAVVQQSAPTPEVLYLRAELYRACARDAGKAPAERASERAATRAKFVAGLGENVDARRRIDAFDALNADPCSGLDIGTFDPAEMTRLVAAAADAGDPRAQAWQLAERIERAGNEGRPTSPGGYAVDQAAFDDMRRLMSAGDPEVVLDLQNVLSSSLQHGSLRLNGQPIDPQAFHSALTLLACDLGADCGSDAQPLLANCAFRGRCAASTLYEYMYYYESSRADAQQIDAYRRAWQAMLNAGDLSGLTLTPVDGMPGYTMTFGGRRHFRPPG